MTDAATRFVVEWTPSTGKPQTQAFGDFDMAAGFARTVCREDREEAAILQRQTRGPEGWTTEAAWGVSPHVDEPERLGAETPAFSVIPEPHFTRSTVSSDR